MDDFYYHCTLRKYLDNIEIEGLTIGNSPTVSNYKNYSRGKIFLCDAGSVDWWKDRIEQHAFHSFDDEEFHDVAVLKIKKTDLSDVKIDKVGSEDSRGNSYYVDHDIPPELILLTDL